MKLSKKNFQFTEKSFIFNFIKILNYFINLTIIKVENDHLTKIEHNTDAIITIESGKGTEQNDPMLRNASIILARSTLTVQGPGGRLSTQPRL